MLEEYGGETAAFIVEPIQGEAGVVVDNRVSELEMAGTSSALRASSRYSSRGHDRRKGISAASEPAGVERSVTKARLTSSGHQRATSA